MRAAAIVPAAGQGVRMHSDRPKALILLLGRTMLSWTLKPIHACGLFSEIIVACMPGEEQAFRESLSSAGGLTSVRLIAGGGTRQHSVENCLKQISNTDLVAIHDGARPLVTEDILRTTLQKAAETGAAIASVPAKDTVKWCDEHGVIRQTLERERLRLAQTPQCFHLDIIKKAHENARQKDIAATDDSALVELLGVEVHAVMGSYENIKVTTPEDLLVCEEILQRRQSSANRNRI